MSKVYADCVKVSRRFTRSVRVDIDTHDPAALEGYVCPQSAVDTLLAMARHRAATSHSAFTWTGPYGSGKSSLAVALAVLLQGEFDQVETAFAGNAAQAEVDEIVSHFRNQEEPWCVAPLVGRRLEAQELIEEAVNSSLPKPVPRRKNESVADWVGRVASDCTGSGLALILDEMGKFLEHAALEQSDVHVFQELAEVASRSGGRLLLVGILHQAFDEYAQRLSRESRDEWLKIQGRYLDLPVNLAADEQIDLISRAIQNPDRKSVDSACRVVATAIRGGRAVDSKRLADRLAACWPLHPLTAGLLGPISRRRFGQSQRSIFGFLTSAEPFGFQEFLAKTELGRGRFSAAMLWDYLKANLEAAILASPDGHRWSTAVDAVERCEIRGGSEIHLAAIKTIALLDLFKDRSGLQASPEIIVQSVGLKGEQDWQEIEGDLLKWSVVVFRKHVGSYAIFAGSDFEIEAAIDAARARGVGTDFKLLEEQPALRPVLAKRHYEKTGALRWFEVGISSLADAEDRVRNYKPAPGSAGLFLVLVSTDGETKAVARKIARSAAGFVQNSLVLVGWTRDSYMLRELTSDLAALDHVRSNSPELEGDPVARREIDARISKLSADLDDQLRDAIEKVDWFGPATKDIEDFECAGPAGLSLIASKLADWRYPDTPKLHNELINRTKPSSNATGAMRALLHAMVERRGQEQLGFQSFPPEAGLASSLLFATGLYGPDERGGHSFMAPSPGDDSNLCPIWEAADGAIQSAEGKISLTELYDLWRSPPFGVRAGLLPVLALAYLLSRDSRTSFYLEGVFRPQLDSFFVDRMLQDPAEVKVRDVEINDQHVSIVSELAEKLANEQPIAPTALEVARTLVGRVRALPNWTLRTSTLSAEATSLRQLGLKSHDPNKLLFEDLPEKLERKLKQVPSSVVAALSELESAYPRMLHDLIDTLFRELRYTAKDDQGFATLYERCHTIHGLTGNFRLDALATRLGSYSGEISDIEGIASLAANKPARDWVDRDIDSAKIELAALAQQFLRAEGFAHLKGRNDRQVSLAVYVSDPSYPAPVSPSVELDDAERLRAQDLAREIKLFFENEKVSPEIAVGAIARLGLDLAKELAKDEGGKRVKVA